MCLGITGVVTAITGDEGVPMALIDTPGTARARAVMTACLLTCPQARVGDTVLIHSGYVLRILDATARNRDPREDSS